MKLRRQYYKGDVIVFEKNGALTNQSVNMDRDRKLAVGDVFHWQVNEKMQPTTMKVMEINFPLIVKEIKSRRCQ